MVWSVENPSELQILLSPDENVTMRVKEGVPLGEEVFLTDRRIILRKPKALGLRAMVRNYYYSEIADISLVRGILRSDVEIKMRSGSDIKLGNLSKDEAYILVKAIEREIRSTYQTPNLRARPPEHERKPSPVTRACISCGMELDSRYDFCPHCGFELTKRCPKCKQKISIEYSFCPYCKKDLLL